ncbi:MAG: tRNA (guanosine(37)-N1)-methyltransferase TrmD [Eubacteriales bacterium]|nr:tRNA (guanosine(37)-N1)-methyltransferase TrmD [Eubacteriales bacterium]
MGAHAQKKYSVITLFPELIDFYLKESIPGRAQAAGLYELNLVQLRDYAINDYGKVDDKVYGGGHGMLIMPEPLYQAWSAVRAESQNPAAIRTLYCSPRGRKLDQAYVEELAAEDELVIICGHYEGVDERALSACQAEEISLGDFVLTGGELCAMTIIDAVLRLIPGVLPAAEAWQNDSFAHDLLAEAQYSRPAEWRGLKVPEVLLSGDDKKIDQFRRQSSLLETYQKRPDLLATAKLSKKDWELLINAVKSLDSK